MLAGTLIAISFVHFICAFPRRDTTNISPRISPHFAGATMPKKHLSPEKKVVILTGLQGGMHKTQVAARMVVDMCTDKRFARKARNLPTSPSPRRVPEALDVDSEADGKHNFGPASFQSSCIGHACLVLLKTSEP